jgi:hypothetical protein
MSDTKVRLARIVARRTESSISAEMVDGTLVRELKANGMSELDLVEAIQREFKVKLSPAQLGRFTLGQVAEAIDALRDPSQAVACCKCKEASTTVVEGKPYCDTHLAALRAPPKKEQAA